jgi:hypothetical protein
MDGVARGERSGTFVQMKVSFLALRTAFFLLGVAAVAIGAMVFVFGPSATARMFAAVLSAVAHTPADVDGLSGPNIDSEMRFYAVLWIAYGVLALWVARALAERVIWLRLLLLVFWLGGVGRGISLFAQGAPHPLFGVLMWIELLLPTLLIGLSFRSVRRAPIDGGN